MLFHSEGAGIEGAVRTEADIQRPVRQAFAVIVETPGTVPVFHWGSE